MSVTLYDPAGFRGSRHCGGERKTLRIDGRGASPGAVPGPLPPGRWTAELDTCLILPGTPVEYRAEIRLRGGSSGGEGAWPQLPAVRAVPGWYRGDLHTHTVHSDGSQTVPELLEAARGHGLDFVALTDHNTIGQLQDPAVAGCSDLALIPGVELTTFWGHAVALGVTDWIDWRTRRQGRTMGSAVADVHGRGGLAVMANPAGQGDPACTGCAWLYVDQMPGEMDAVEVWNGPWYEVGTNSPDSLRWWYDWLNQGRHRRPRPPPVRQDGAAERRLRTRALGGGRAGSDSPWAQLPQQRARAGAGGPAARRPDGHDGRRGGGGRPRRGPRVLAGRSGRGAGLVGRQRRRGGALGRRAGRAARAEAAGGALGRAGAARAGWGDAGAQQSHLSDA